MAIRLNDDEEFGRLENLIDRMVQIGSPSRWGDACLDAKLDVLDRAIEMLRIRQKRLKNEQALENFVQGDLCVSAEAMTFLPAAKCVDIGTGTRPVMIQPNLLIFLLSNHDPQARVLDQIEGFVFQIWDLLDELDFKKTETGVFRCFTNIRFAAKTLREYGLLRDSKDAMYKFWRLTLPGFLVAANVLRKYGPGWNKTCDIRKFVSGLHNDIRDACSQIRAYDQLYAELRRTCAPDVSIFQTFGPMLENAHSMLAEYWKIMTNNKMTAEDRKTANAALLSRIEGLPQMDQFCRELSRSINIQNMWAQV